MRTHAEVKDESRGGRLVTVDGKSLPLRAVELAADAKGGLARTVVRQTFANPYEVPLKVTYQLPLPADGAVSGFTFTVGDERISGEVDRKASARERFERALVEGKSASLLEQDRSSLFTQEVGNIPSGQEVQCEVVIDQPLAWLAEGAWEWRFPTVVAPRYQGAKGRVADAARQQVDVADRTPPIAFCAKLLIRDALEEIPLVESPSHSVTRKREGGFIAVELRNEGTVRPALDRDVVMRWQVAQPEVGLALDLARSGAGPLSEASFGLLTLVPPSVRARSVRRDLIFLIDTSGSMGGEPLEQARRVAAAMVDTLGDEDRLEMIEFSDSPHRWKLHPIPATARNKQAAFKWLGKLEAGGATEMKRGILSALKSLDDEAQRQVVLITDGLIGFESEIVDAIAHACPEGSRVHTVGIGSSVNRSLTGPAARAGRGTEVVIGLGEDPERAARKLVAATDAPTVVEVTLDGSALLEHAPARISDLFARAPARVALKLRPQGGTLRVTGRTAEGRYSETLEVPACEAGSGSGALAALFGREQVEDLELEVAAGSAGDPLEHHAPSLDARIEALGLLHQISTRLTSWVAVSEKTTVDPRDPTRAERIPHALPHGMSVEGLGLRTASLPLPSAQSMPPPRRRSAVQGRLPSGATPPPLAAMPTAKRLSKREDVSGGGFGEEEDDFALGDAGNEPTGSFEVPDEASEDEPAAADSSAPPSRLASPAATSAGGSAEKERRRGGGDPEDEKTDFVADASDLEEADAVPEEGAPPRMRGRVVLRTKRELVVEVILERAATWDPTETGTLTFGNGKVLTFAVVLARSTRGGDLPAGTVLRVVLELAEEMPLESPVEAEVMGLDGGCSVRFD